MIQGETITFRLKMIFLDANAKTNYTLLENDNKDLFRIDLIMKFYMRLWWQYVHWQTHEKATASCPMAIETDATKTGKRQLYRTWLCHDTNFAS